ncbi:MAG: hypothetical protein ACXWZU_12440 [Actinomycetota bacterium]
MPAALAQPGLRGRASILMDGVLVGTVDTYAPVNTNWIVVFDRTMTAGTHTLTIANQGTPDRPRIDVTRSSRTEHLVGSGLGVGDRI